MTTLANNGVRQLFLTETDVNKIIITYPDLPFDIDPFIKGIRQYETDISVVYRDWLPEKKSDMASFQCLYQLKKLGAKPKEIARIPISALLYKSRIDPDCDFVISDPTKRGAKEHSRFWYKPCVVRRYGKYKFLNSMSKVRPFDLVFLPSCYGGLDRHGWNQDSRVSVRDVYNQLPGKKYAKSKNELRKLLGKQRDDYREDFDESLLEPPLGCYLATTKSVYEGSLYNAEIISLETHTRLVWYYCERFLCSLGMQEYLDDFKAAADYHDLGKADPRFQRYMTPLGLMPNFLLAKPLNNMVGPRVEPRGWRHELLSLAILRDNNIKVSALTSHLIGSHHGKYRPYVPELVDTLHQPFSFELCGKQWISKSPFNDFVNKNFVELNAKHGPWGLAYLEVIFRLADHAASAHKGELPWKK